MERPEYPEYVLPHSDFGDPDCCGLFFPVERGDRADVTCNGCRLVLNSVPVADVRRTVAHETKTEAIRRGLEERRERLISASARGQGLISFLGKQVWPLIREEVRNIRVTREEEEQIPGCGHDGY